MAALAMPFEIDPFCESFGATASELHTVEWSAVGSLVLPVIDVSKSKILNGKDESHLAAASPFDTLLQILHKKGSLPGLFDAMLGRRVISCLWLPVFIPLVDVP